MSKLKVLELFGGIGACTKALKRLNIDFEVVDYVEIDKYAVNSYNAINNTNFESQDITKWDKNIEVDLIMHGSPCQDISIAGNQAGADENSGTRSSLMYETLRIVNKLKPKYVVWENVKNLISDKHWHNFNNYLQQMQNLGYDSYYNVLNAKDYGIPQNRERVFTISIRQDLNSNGYYFPEKQKLKLRLKDMLDKSVDEKYYLSDKAINFFKQNEIKQRERGNGFRFNVTNGDNIAKTITTCAGSRMDDNFIDCVRLGGVFDKDGEIHQAGSIYDTNGISPTLDTMQGGWRQPSVVVDSVKDEINVVGNYMPSEHDSSRVVDTSGIAPTVKENHGTVTAIIEEANDNADNIDYVVGKYQNFIKEHEYFPKMFNPYNETEITDIAPTQTTNCGSSGSSATVLVSDDNPSIQCVDVVQQVKVRKYEVNIIKLSQLLIESKKSLGISNSEIADYLGLPVSQVEHYFRKDNYFAIPNPEIWFKLKEILNITTNEFDESIMTFIVKDGVFESGNRVYDVNGIAPTLDTSDSKKIIEYKGKEVELPIICASRGRNLDNFNNEATENLTEQTLEVNTDGVSNTITTVQKDNYVIEPNLEIDNPLKGVSGQSWHFEQNVYSENSKLIRTIKAGEGSGNIPKIIESDTERVIELNSDVKHQQDLLKTLVNEKDDNSTEDSVEISNEDRRLQKLVDNIDYKEGEALNLNTYNQTDGSETSQTITMPNHNNQELFNGLRIRKLTPLECWRLMGFDDEDYYKAEKVNSNTQLYKQAGNSIVVNVLYAILQNLVGDEEKRTKKGIRLW